MYWKSGSFGHYRQGLFSILNEPVSIGTILATPSHEPVSKVLWRLSLRYWWLGSRVHRGMQSRDGRGTLERVCASRLRLGSSVVPFSLFLVQGSCIK